jgi:hypothetical protein
MLALGPLRAGQPALQERLELGDCPDLPALARNPGQTAMLDYSKRQRGLSTLVEKDLCLWRQSSAAITVAANRGTGIAEATLCTKMG